MLAGHPELLEDRADEMLDVLIDRVGADDELTALIWRQHRDLLRRCREIGVQRPMPS